GVLFIGMATKLHIGVTKGEEVKPLKLFILSNNYLAILFIALSVDAVIGMPTISDHLGWDTTFF
ncbi:MAG: protoheme IX farnesyltransferase, partial [Corynebacterium sp.]|nr:protoheme IX farnesyltransferase [Corynebacterium sp.]